MNTSEEDTIDYFLTSVHELRTSLSAMKWVFQMLLEEDFGKLNETQSSMLKQASESNERMLKILNKTISGIKDSNQTQILENSQFSFNALMEESLRDLMTMALRKKINIKYNWIPETITLIGDMDKIRIVLHNLIENAIKYSKSDTDILISLRRVTDKVVLRITNEGELISIADQSKIFNKFFRKSNSGQNLDDQNEGGLGLYLSKKIALQHQGDLSFESNDQGLTTFELTLPIHSS